ncbi:EAL domain-containing protein [Propionivibrio limicola]|uniref:EAL domain-containing protein n=1 Tax=Propionivibrio limicola TaxID=167645 RepID=UPI0012908D46|nr:EAL domain-containing protein [Propionivibrio limicola]
MKRNFAPWLSLRTKIPFAALSVFLVGIWSLSLFGIQMLREDTEQLLGDQQFSTVSVVAAQIDAELENRLKSLQTVADGAALAWKTHGEAGMQSLIENRTVTQMMFNGGLVVHDINGVAIADVPLSAGRIGVNYLDSEPVAIAIKEGRPAIGKPVIGRKLKAPIIGLAVPIKDQQGQVIGALSGAIQLGLPNFLDRLTASHYGKTGGYLIVAPQHRLVVTATDKHNIMNKMPEPGAFPAIDRFSAGHEGSVVFTNPFGVEVLASAKRIPIAGWFAVATLPTSEAFAPIEEMQRRILIATTLLTLLSALLIWWLLRRQLAPVLDTASQLAAMAENEQPLRPLPVVRQDEIGQLIGGFNRLIQTLEQRELLLKQILDTSSVGIFLVDTGGRITQANQRMAEMFGYPLDTLVGNEYVALIHPAERETGRQKMLALLASELTAVDLDRRYWRADQTEFWGHLTGKRFYGANGVERGLVGVIADIDVRKKAEQKLQLAANVFTHAREGILITAQDGAIIDVNNAFTRITGYTRDEVLGKNPRLFKSGHHGPEFYAALWRDLLEKGEWSGEIWNRRKNGEVYAEMRTISAVRDATGAVQQYVSLFSDITPIKEHEKQLEHMAHYDVLTSLPNRVLLADRLHQAMAQAMRHQQLLAVAYLDLDGFKAINDTYGHETGDQLLIALAQRMKNTLREGDTLARLGGDEFVAVLLDLDEASLSVAMISRLLAAAAQPVPIGDRQLQVSASLGVTFFPQAEGVDADQLLRQADQAMYQAKLAGKNRYHIFDAEQDRSVRGHHESLQRIQEALSAREFVLHFQPKVNMRSGKVIGAEALIRWQHPEKGLLPPSVFLPVIENHAMAIDIGEWVIDAALGEVEHWRAAGLDIPVSVNVGARQLQRPNFVARLRDILAVHPSIRPGDLELEVLETSALEDLIRVSQVIKECRELGVTFALDDFGTGYSSLTYLKRLPVSQLKIDQSFVRDMLDDPDDLTILEGVISLGTAFQRDIIAEGVETVAHGELLLQLGCELAQGYGIARPMPAASVPAWTAAWRPDDAWVNVPPINRDDMPLLFAGAEHRAWISAMARHLQDELKPRPLDIEQCRFGAWLVTEGKARYGHREDFTAIDRLHQQAHARANELCRLRDTGRTAEAQAGIADLYELRDELLTQLQALIRNAQPLLILSD